MSTVSFHLTTSAAAFSAWSAALSAANPNWQKQRQAASTLATAETNAARYRGIISPSLLDQANVDEGGRRLGDARQQHEDAKS